MPMPERLPVGEECPKRVRVIAPGKHHGQEGTVKLIYYDRLHTGSSYDELSVELDNGNCIAGALSLFERVDEVAYVPGA